MLKNQRAKVEKIFEIKTKKILFFFVLFKKIFEPWHRGVLMGVWRQKKVPLFMAAQGMRNVFFKFRCNSVVYQTVVCG